MKITYAITVCNEFEKFSNLISRLTIGISPEDQILVQSDSNKVTFEIQNFINVNELQHVSIPLDGDFSKFKNNIYSYATGDWIFFIDADEYIEPEFLSEIKQVLMDVDDEIEAIAVPRINIVHGITEEYIKKWGWRSEHILFGDDEVEIINFPDYQWRIQRNVENVRWHGNVHETLKGFKIFSVLPQQRPYCLIHIKNIETQINQNSLYESI
jgi:glycosyltransferase involved in cell wall biosynthesis